MTFQKRAGPYKVRVCSAYVFLGPHLVLHGERFMKSSEISQKNHQILRQITIQIPIKITHRNPYQSPFFVRSTVLPILRWRVWPWPPRVRNVAQRTMRRTMETARRIDAGKCRRSWNVPGISGDFHGDFVPLVVTGTMGIFLVNLWLILMVNIDG